MTQAERRNELIRYLLAEQPQYRDTVIPNDTAGQKQMLRALLNMRMPVPADSDFLCIQDTYLKAEIAGKGITDYRSLTPTAQGIYLWQGDITTLKCDAIVNAANSKMLGCFCPNHGCIDNAIHTFAGVQLRFACAELMSRQGHDEPVGKAKITSAYNLPCRYVIHTVGPIVYGGLTKREEVQLASCYRSCLKLAEENDVRSIAFCCISTGEFRFPNERAAQIAIATVKEYRKQANSKIEVIFNVFKENDCQIYQRLLS